MDRWGLTFPLDGVPLPAHREVLQQAEALGYTDAWTMEVDGLDAFVPAALAASWTNELRLGTAIANVFTRGPALLAQNAAAVAEVAPDRFCLGIGSSSPAIVENWNGVELRRPLARVRDTVAFLRATFAGERATSEALGVRGFRLGRRFAPPPPIFVAALREKMLALAGSAGDGVIINWLSPGDVPKVVRVAREAAQSAGRDPDALEVVCRIFVLLTENEEMARFIARRAIAGYMTTPVYGGFQRWLGRGDALLPMQEAWQAGDRKQATELVPDQVIDDLFVIGGRQACLDKIEAYVRNGVTVPVLSFMPTSSEPKELGERNIAALKELARG
ncbi:MAG: LLM class F420-dependent oxidoreductase [Chloroflexi bacterium]|nr:LLM class F420-dependent oxidoreductase [Chloroflexota bacterium]